MVDQLSRCTSVLSVGSYDILDADSAKSQMRHLLFETPKKISKVTFSETIQASIKPAKSSWLHQVAKDLLDPNIECERVELS